MSRTLLQAAFTCVIAFALCVGCENQEREADLLLIQATSLLQRGNLVELKEHLDKVISEHPDTDAARKAEEMLAELAAGANNTAENILMSALAATIGYSVSYPDETLDLRKIKEFGFEGMEGVRIDFVRSVSNDYLITASHAAGDKVFTVGRDGVISARAK
jgi:hypothetical protein